MAIDSNLLNDADPSDYPADRFQFRADSAGRPIVIRPREFLASGDPVQVRAALSAVAQELNVGSSAVDPVSLRRTVNDPETPWFRYVLTGPEDTDVLRLVQGLRQRGIPAQPNHVYFIASLSAQGTTVSAPNTFTPNTFTGQVFAPNTFTPNTFTPNTFTGGAWGGGGCCCEAGPAETVSVPVPQFGARPAEAPAADPAVAEPAGHDRLDVHVIDIASPLAAEHKANAVGELDKATIDPPGNPGKGEIDFRNTSWNVNENLDDWADPATGHGDFVRSVLRLHSGLKAPNLTLWHAAGPLGDIDDAALVSALNHAVAKSKPDCWRILNLSLCGYNDGDLSALYLADRIRTMVDDGWVIVAAAGNNASCRPAYPAALPGVVAVAALSRCVPAWFSNFGPWVDVAVRGVDVLAELPDMSQEDPGVKALKVGIGELPSNPGTKVMLQLGDFNTGWATWSGTSFAAPRVAAWIGRALADEDPAQAADSAAKRAVIASVLKRVIDKEDCDWLPYYGRLMP